MASTLLNLGTGRHLSFSACNTELVIFYNKNELKDGKLLEVKRRNKMNKKELSGVVQKGTFETGRRQYWIPEELKAFTEKHLLLFLPVIFHDQYHSIRKKFDPSSTPLDYNLTGINSIQSQPNMRHTETSGRVLRETRVVEDEMFGIENLCWISSRESHILSRKRRFCNIWCSSAHGDAIIYPWKLVNEIWDRTKLKLYYMLKQRRGNLWLHISCKT
ncbi:hypothetical protein YC2023_020762 [Brassica napus]